MKGVELYGQVRRAVYVEGLSRRELARRFGIDPRTVAKMLAFLVPSEAGAGTAEVQCAAEGSNYPRYLPRLTDRWRKEYGRLKLEQTKRLKESGEGELAA
jgi:hypothetical protein